MSRYIDRHKNWSKKEEAKFRRDKLSWGEDTEENATYFVYELVVETMGQTYNYIGQTSNLHDRLRQHNHRFNVAKVYVLWTTNCRDEALRMEKIAIMDASDEFLLNKQHNCCYKESSISRAMLCLSRHLIGCTIE